MKEPIYGQHNDFIESSKMGAVGFQLWKNATIGFAGSTYHLPGLMDISSGALTLRQDLGRWHLSTKYLLICHSFCTFFLGKHRLHLRKNQINLVFRLICTIFAVETSRAVIFGWTHQPSLGNHGGQYDVVVLTSKTFQLCKITFITFVMHCDLLICKSQS